MPPGMPVSPGETAPLTRGSVHHRTPPVMSILRRSPHSRVHVDDHPDAADEQEEDASSHQPSGDAPEDGAEVGHRRRGDPAHPDAEEPQDLSAEGASHHADHRVAEAAETEA